MKTIDHHNRFRASFDSGSTLGLDIRRLSPSATPERAAIPIIFHDLGSCQRCKTHESIPIANATSTHWQERTY